MLFGKLAMSSVSVGRVDFIRLKRRLDMRPRLMRVLEGCESDNSSLNVYGENDNMD